MHFGNLLQANLFSVNCFPFLWNPKKRCTGCESQRWRLDNHMNRARGEGFLSATRITGCFCDHFSHDNWWSPGVKFSISLKFQSVGPPLFLFIQNLYQKQCWFLGRLVQVLWNPPEKIVNHEHWTFLVSDQQNVILKTWEISDDSSN